MNAHSVDSQAQEFDLSLFNGTGRQWKRGFLALYIVGILGLGLIWVDGVLTNLGMLVHGGLGGRGFLFVVIWGLYGSFILFVAFAGIPRNLPGARSVVVDGAGVQLKYASGRVDRFHWTSPKDRFSIQDYSAHGSWAKTGVYVLYIPFRVKPGRDRRTILSKEATEAILRAAQERGARYSTYRGNAAWYGRSPVIHCIQGNSR